MRTKLARLSGAGPGALKRRGSSPSGANRNARILTGVDPGEREAAGLLGNESSTGAGSDTHDVAEDGFTKDLPSGTPSERSSPLRDEMRARVDAIRKRLESMDRKRVGEQARRTFNSKISSDGALQLGGSPRGDRRLCAAMHLEVDGSEFSQTLLGETVETEWGGMHRVRKRLRPSHVQGKTPISVALHASSRAMSRIALDPDLEGVDLERALYFDTETTGLSGGTGTLAFLLGLAWFEERELVLEQLVLRRPGEEGPMLQRFAERVRASSCLVSYNGKSFDWPLLRTRFVMNRVKPPELPPHIDLLHCARRVFKARLDDVSLTSVEEQVLGMGRVNDVSGARIPDSYARFLEGAPGSVLNGVIEHNAHDLISLAAVLGDLSMRFECDPTVACATDQLGLARTAFRARDFDAAEALATEASRVVEDRTAQATAREASWLNARVAKRRGDWETAIDWLERALACVGESPAAEVIHLELSKLFEHRLRDFSRARTHADSAAELEGPEAHAKRVARITRREARRLKLSFDYKASTITSSV